MAGPFLDRKKFYCREWAFLKLAHCLEQRPVSKTCGAFIVGGPGSGKTSLCCEIVWPSAGNAGRQQRSLRRRLLAYHFCQVCVKRANFELRILNELIIIKIFVIGT